MASKPTPSVFAVVMRRLLAVWDDALMAVALIGGWLLITAGVAHLTAPVTWLFSLGLLLISLCGWRMAGIVAWYGVYHLTKAAERRNG